MKNYKNQSFKIILLVVFFIYTTDSFSQEDHSKETSKINSVLPDFNPEFEKIKSRVSYVPGIMVIRGETHLIVPEHESFCPSGSVFKFNNGDIQVYNRRSSDGGKTWSQVDHILENSTYQFPEPDGEVIMFQSANPAGSHSNEGRPEVSLQKTDKIGVFEANFFRSEDNGISRVSEPAKIFLPEEFADWSGVLCRKIVRLEDESLLMSMYLRNPDGNIYEKMFRVLALRSTDRGKTWHYISTIAFDMADDVRGEGFDEASLLVLPDGRIYSFMRSGASYQASIGSYNNNDWNTKMPFSYGKQTSIYKSVSIDGGKNWSVPDPITSHGVWPDALQLENGIIAMTYGRPGNWIMFNDGENETWGPVIPFYNDLYPPDCGNYVSMTEVAPNIILVVYSRTNPNNHWKSEFVGTYFKVEAMVVE